ncbi:MAG: hypothetical protein K9H64_20815 [Bacteroidales bacterium]|nr:hypothetical protein [Bacteroidales bacterium]MCF8458450.1 hypothetical protein [Bacteroidales bacterium]
METLCFVLLKFGADRLDSLLFFVPLALLIVLWGSTHLIRFIRHKVQDYREMILSLKEEEKAEEWEAFLSPV